METTFDSWNLSFRKAITENVKWIFIHIYSDEENDLL